MLTTSYETENRVLFENDNGEYPFSRRADIINALLQHERHADFADNVSRFAWDVKVHQNALSESIAQVTTDLSCYDARWQAYLDDTPQHEIDFVGMANDRFVRTYNKNNQTQIHPAGRLCGWIELATPTFTLGEGEVENVLTWMHDEALAALYQRVVALDKMITPASIKEAVTAQYQEARDRFEGTIGPFMDDFCYDCSQKLIAAKESSQEDLFAADTVDVGKLLEKEMITAPLYRALVEAVNTEVLWCRNAPSPETYPNDLFVAIYLAAAEEAGDALCPVFTSNPFAHYREGEGNMNQDDIDAVMRDPVFLLQRELMLAASQAVCGLEHETTSMRIPTVWVDHLLKVMEDPCIEVTNRPALVRPLNMNGSPGPSM